MAVTKPKQYELQEVVMRLEKGRKLYSEQPIDTVDAAVAVMKQELSQYEREVLCVVNLNTKLKPINFNIVSVGNLKETIADIPYIVRSALFSNANWIIITTLKKTKCHMTISIEWRPS